MRALPQGPGRAARISGRARLRIEDERVVIEDERPLREWLGAGCQAVARGVAEEEAAEFAHDRQTPPVAPFEDALGCGRVEGVRGDGRAQRGGGGGRRLVSEENGAAEAAEPRVALRDRARGVSAR